MSDVILSRVCYGDAEELIAANIASRDHHAPWVQSFTDTKGFDVWFGQMATGPNIGFIARESETGGIVGVINASQIVWGAFRSAYLGYYGMATFARQGLMTKALRLSISELFIDVGLHRVEANIQPGNLASIALAKRLGFHREGFSPRYLKIDGEWRDHERWALLSDAAA